MRILVTGAGRAIGAAIANTLAGAGHHVVATARDPSTLADLDVSLRLPLDVSLAFVVIVPDLVLSTSRARQVLPLEVSRENAAFNLSRLALLIAGLGDSRLLVVDMSTCSSSRPPSEESR